MFPLIKGLKAALQLGGASSRYSPIDANSKTCPLIILTTPSDLAICLSKSTQQTRTTAIIVVELDKPTPENVYYEP